MNSRDFCFWLQGYIEISGLTAIELVESKWNMIKEHFNIIDTTNEDTNVFTEATTTIRGFLAISDDMPNEVQWIKICVLISECFTKVTPELEEVVKQPIFPTPTIDEIKQWPPNIPPVWKWPDNNLPDPNLDVLC